MAPFRLREIGVDAAQIQIVGDRAEDMLAALQLMADQGLDLVVTSGGLGPTADDLTAEVVGRFCGREMVLDPDLEERICRVRCWPAGPTSTRTRCATRTASRR